MSSGNWTWPAKGVDYVIVFSDLINHVVLPSVCLMGITGQSLNLTILSRMNSRMKSNPSCTITLLIAMGCFNLVFIVMQLPVLPIPFLQEQRNDHVQLYELFSCYFLFLQYPFANTCLTVTSWLAVAVTVERVHAIKCGLLLQAPQLTTQKRLSLCIITVVFSVSVAVNLTRIPELGGQLVCSAASDWLTNATNSTERQDAANHTAQLQTETQQHLLDLLHCGRSVCTLLLPLLLTALFNAYLLHLVIEYMHRPSFVRRNCNKNVTFRTTTMVFGSVTFNALCDSVGGYLTVVSCRYGRAAMLDTELMSLLTHVSNVLVILHSSIDFVIFSCLSSQYRTVLSELLCHRCSPHREHVRANKLQRATFTEI